MKANVLKAVGDLQYIDYKTPVLKRGWALVKVKAAGICGSDVARVFTTGTYHFPTIIGHEFAGIVDSVFDSDDDGWIGKRVSVFPLIPCGDCPNCKEGKYELCSHYNYLGSRCDGGFAEYVAVPKWNLLKISDNISMESAAMFEPASVALHALRNAKVKIGDNVAIVGPGTIGMIEVQLSMIAGAKNVILIGRSQEKLDYASQKFGIRVINSLKDNVTDIINETTDGQGVDIAVEGTGASQSMEICLNIAKSSGTILAMGNPLGDMHLDKASYWKILRKQLTMVGTWNSAYGTSHSDWDTIKSLVEQNKLNLEQLITHRFDLSGLLEGLEIMRNPKIYSNKVMIINK